MILKRLYEQQAIHRISKFGGQQDKPRDFVNALAKIRGIKGNIHYSQ